MNNVRSVEHLVEEEFNHGVFGGVSKGSWHEKYKDSAWVFLGGLDYELTEGDIICVMSQWGEIEDIHLVREKDTGKSKGFAFVKYEDHRSTILAVDNFNGAKLLGRTLRCDHVEQYKLPKDVQEQEAKNLEANPQARVQIWPGHAYKGKELASEYDINRGVDLWEQPALSRPRRAHEDDLIPSPRQSHDDRDTAPTAVKQEEDSPRDESPRCAVEERGRRRDRSASYSDDSRRKKSKRSDSESEDSRRQDKRKKRKRDRSRSRSSDSRDRERKDSERSRHRGHRDRDRDRERDRDRDRDEERDYRDDDRRRHRDRDRDGDRGRDRDRDRSRERDRERDRRREYSDDSDDDSRRDRHRRKRDKKEKKHKRDTRERDRDDSENSRDHDGRGRRQGRDDDERLRRKREEEAMLAAALTAAEVLGPAAVGVGGSSNGTSRVGAGSTIPLSAGAPVASWRGRKDPELRQRLAVIEKKLSQGALAAPSSASSSSAAAKQGEFRRDQVGGIAGVGRIR